jgi:hypothetical protein
MSVSSMSSPRGLSLSACCRFYLYRIRGFLRGANLAFCAVLLSVFLPAAGYADEPLFPIGSHIGLVPPPGMTASRTFPGFEDRARNATIQINELPGPAYDGFLRSMNSGQINLPGVSNARREILITQGGAAHLLIGDQEASGEKFRKWLLITRQTVASEKVDLTMAFVVTVQVPDEAKDAYSDEAVRKALRTVTLRTVVPGEESLSLLPVRVNDLAGFTAIRPLIPGRAVLLSETPLGNAEPTDAPFITLSVAPGRAPEDAEERRKFSEQLLSGIQGYSDLKVVFAEQLRLRNQYVYEIRLEGKYDRTGSAMMLVQWVRFAPQGFVRLVGITPKESWEKNFPRFRTVRDGIENR